MASCQMMKRMRLGSSVYLLLRAFIVIIRNEKELDNFSNGVASSSIPVHKMLLFAQYNWRKWLKLDWPVPAGKTTVHYVVTATSRAPRSVSCTITTPHDA